MNNIGCPPRICHDFLNGKVELLPVKALTEGLIVSLPMNAFIPYLQYRRLKYTLLWRSQNCVTSTEKSYKKKSDFAFTVSLIRYFLLFFFL